jgi:nucleoside-diphosphate-sugar epimerase
MRLLVLGGTAWLGRYIAATGVERGYHVTCLARGESGAVPPGAAFTRADRDGSGAYREVGGEEWDVVIDVSRQPGQLRRATAALAGGAGSFVFVSSGNVYADHGTPGSDESAALLPALAGDVMESMETYGQAKVACERHVLDGFGPGRTLIARVGLIGGPGDTFDRTGYWPLRFRRPAADDGSVLVPDVPGLATQVIDVRDLASWLVDAGERGLSGIFNVVGETIPLPAHLALAREVAGHTGPVVAAGQDWLAAHDVQPWMGAVPAAVAPHARVRRFQFPGRQRGQSRGADCAAAGRNARRHPCLGTRQEPAMAAARGTVQSRRTTPATRASRFVAPTRA